MVLFAQEGLERVPRRRNNLAAVPPKTPVERLLHRFHERFADEDYAPSSSDSIRLIQYRRGVGEKNTVRVIAGWVRNG